jgi:hypothetical protein
LGLQEMLVYFDPWHAGVVLPTFIIIGLMVIPYIDINPKGNGYYCWNDRKWELLTFILGFHILWVSLIVIGTFLRGPGWNWFWFWEKWDPHKVVALTNGPALSVGIRTRRRHPVRDLCVVAYFVAGIKLTGGCSGSRGREPWSAGGRCALGSPRCGDDACASREDVPPVGFQHKIYPATRGINI